MDLGESSRSSGRVRHQVSYVEPDESEFSDRPSRRVRLDESGKSISRSTAQLKPSPLDVMHASDAPLPGKPSGWTYSIGGGDCGGAEAERVLREVEIDDNAIMVRQAFATCRRIVLYRGNTVVAAAVAEMHASAGVLELPIVAASRSSRYQGFGSILVALTMELGVQLLGAKVLCVSATPESRRFWMSQGLHAMQFCPPPVAATLRALAQSGARYGFFETTQMARLMPLVGEPGELISAALSHIAERRVAPPRGMGAGRAAEMLGYEDVHSNFYIDASGARVAVDDGKGRPVDVPASRLQAFCKDDSAKAATGQVPWGEPGWGVRCSVPIYKGQVVAEVCGELIGDSEHEKLAEKRFAISLDRRRGGSAELSGYYLDLRASASVARLVSACAEAPNLELLVSAGDGNLPASSTMCEACSGKHRAHTCDKGPLMMPSPVSTLLVSGSTLPNPAAPVAGVAGVAGVVGVDSHAASTEDDGMANPLVRDTLNRFASAAPPPPVSNFRRAYLVARHNIPPMVELRWEGPTTTARRGGRPASSAVQAAAANKDALPAAALDAFPPLPAGEQAGGIAGLTARGAECEVRQHEPGIQGAMFGARRLTGPRNDGLVHVRYTHVYQSAQADTLLSEWVLPNDADVVRPVPPSPPDGFHASLSAGDAVDVWYEAGWWPAQMRAVVFGVTPFEITSTAFPGLCRRVGISHVRPRWRWTGEAGGWKQLGRPA